MKKFLRKKTYNIHGEAMRFMMSYPKDIMTISHLVEVLQSFRNNTELFHYIKETLIAGGNQAHTKKGDDTNE